jgi:hypothetical protein
VVPTLQFYQVEMVVEVSLREAGLTLVAQEQPTLAVAVVVGMVLQALEPLAVQV